MQKSPESSPRGENNGVPANQVYVMAGACLVFGLLVGYFLLGSQVTRGIARTASPAIGENAPTPPNGHPKLTLEQMKQMADAQASTLIEKSKSEPKNASLLVRIAGIYQTTHQFGEAAGYFRKALKIDPRNSTARTQLATCLYYSGDVDGAIDELNQALKYNPKDANSLFNLGMIKYRGKKDPAGAIAAWQQLLKTNPNLDRQPIVEQMIAEAKASPDANN